MSREPVDSTSIASIGYLPGLGILEVEFLQGGVYQYLGVPSEEHQALMQAASKGQHLNRVIKGRFPFQRAGGQR